MHQLVGELPDLFEFSDGKRVRTVEDWQKRREELQELILSVEYGHLPPEPAGVRAELLHPTVMRRLGQFPHFQYRLHIEGGGQPFWFIVDVLLPETEGRFPVIMDGDMCWGQLRDEVILDVMARGYALVTFNRTEIVPDAYRSERDAGLYLVYPEGDFGAIAAWAWGYHRVADFLLTQEFTDPERLAVTGHSRGGKTVLLAGATDERIALTAPNNSGCGGAGCYRWRGEGAETIEDITRSVPYWFAAGFADFVDREDQLPFDQHGVKALVAPRALLSMEALGDVWANPTGTYQTFDAARELYRFLGVEERIGITFREGEHAHGPDDWRTFLDFADWQFRSIQPTRRFDENPFPEMERAFSWSAPEA